MKKIIIIMALAVASLAACTPQDAVYKDLYQQAYKTDFAQKPTNLAGVPGYLSAYLFWEAPVSPTCTDAVIYWNFNKDSLKISLLDPQYNEEGIIQVRIDGLEETDYTFDVYTFDRAGNRSIPSEALVSPKGPKYVESLSSRTVLSAVISEINEAGVVNWGERVKNSPFSELRYFTADAARKTIKVEPSDNSTILKDIDFSNPRDFEYRTVFVTDACRDTLYSEWSKESWFVDPDYSKTVPPGTYCLAFATRKNGTVTQDSENPNQYVFDCTGGDISVNVKALTEPLTKPVLVFQYKQTLPSTSVKVYWIDSGGSATSRRYSAIVLNTHTYGSEEWSVATVDMSEYWNTHLWNGNVGDSARLDFNTTAGNVITIRNVHFRDVRNE